MKFDVYTLIIGGVIGYFIGLQMQEKALDEAKKQAFDEMRLREDWQNKFSQQSAKYGGNL